jgi:ribosomal protein S18 acetylase RimI-like enzyme
VIEDLRIAPLDPSNLESWRRLFSGAHSPCFCRYWHFAGTKNEWLERCALDPAANEADAVTAVACSAAESQGLVALLGDHAVGWMKLTPRAAVPKLRTLPVYRALPLGDDEGVWSIGCFLVHPEYRRHGVADALLAAAPEYVRSRDGRLLEAYPRDPHPDDHAPLHDEEALMGPIALFASHGFAEVTDLGATRMYPVYRRAV